ADADPGWARAGEARREVLPMASALSVFGGDGQTHAAARERVADLFSEAAVGQRGPGITRVAESHIAQWPRGRPFRLLPRMRLLADEPDRPDELLVEELLALLMAAQEPMAAALTWLHLRTGAHPAVRERLAEEGADSPYADAVVRETLRLHPSAVGVLRRITVNTTVC